MKVIGVRSDGMKLYKSIYEAENMPEITNLSIDDFLSEKECVYFECKNELSKSKSLWVNKSKEHEFRQLCFSSTDIIDWLNSSSSCQDLQYLLNTIEPLIIELWLQGKLK